MRSSNPGESIVEFLRDMSASGAQARTMGMRQILTVVALLFLSPNVYAAVWHFSGATFASTSDDPNNDDADIIGGTLTGSFDYNPTSNTVSKWNVIAAFTRTSGYGPSFEFNNDYKPDPDTACGGPAATVISPAHIEFARTGSPGCSYELGVVLRGPLIQGAPVQIDETSEFVRSYSLDTQVIRHIVSGAVVVPEPAAWLSILAFVGLVLLRHLKYFASGART